MLRWFRQMAIGKLMLTALLIFAVGPGLGLHLLGDSFHNSHGHHHHAFDFSTTSIFGDQDGEYACALDHDHDRSHTTNLTIAYLVPPVAIAAVQFDVTLIAYPPESRNTPPLNPTSTIERPPRLTASV